MRLMKTRWPMCWKATLSKPKRNATLRNQRKAPRKLPTPQPAPKPAPSVKKPKRPTTLKRHLGFLKKNKINHQAHQGHQELIKTLVRLVFLVVKIFNFIPSPLFTLTFKTNL